MADPKGMKIRFEADDSKLSSSLNRIESEAKKLTKSLKEIDRYLEFDPSNVTLLAQKHDILTKSIENTTQQLKAMESSQEKITAGYKNWLKNKEAVEATEAAISELRKKQTELNAVIKEKKLAVDQKLIPKEELYEAEKALGTVTKKVRELQAEKKKLAAEDGLVNEASYQRYITSTEGLRINLQQLQQQQAQAAAAIADGGRSAEEAARKAEEQAKAEEERKAATERAAAADKQAKKASEDYKGALDKLKTAANNVKNDIQGMATAVATGITAVGGAVVAGTTAVTKTGMEFTKSMSNVQALSGATADELKSLRDAASDAGASTSKTASEAADALGFMALAGWDSKQMLEGLMPVLRASEAGAMDLATCSDLVTDSMSAMGIAVGDLQHYLDVCAKTQSSANTSMEELLEAYVNCGGILNQLNVPLETSAALLGTLANRGIKGSEAGKSLNAILVNLIGANKNAASAMKDMGVSAFDAQGRFIGLEETLKLVKSKLDEYGNDTERITQLEAKLGGKTQLDTLMALLSGVSTEYDSLNGKIQNCNGSLEATAKTMQDNLSGDITSLKSALEGVENTIFSSLEAPFRDAAQNVTNELRHLNNACNDGELADSIKRISTTLGEFITKIAKFAADDAFPTLIKWLDWVSNHSNLVVSSITGIGAAWGTWKIGQVVKDVIELVVSTKAVIAAHNANAAAQAEVAATAAAAAAGEGALATATDTATIAQKGQNAAMLANPYILVASAVAALAVGFVTLALKADTASNRISEYRDEVKKLDKEVDDFASTTQKSINSTEAEIKILKDKADTYEDLRQIENRTADQEEALKDLAADLQQYMPEGTSLIDAQTGAYNSLANSIDGVIASMRKNAYVQAYNDEITAIATSEIEAKDNLVKLQAEFDALDSRLKDKGAVLDSEGHIGFENFTDALINMKDLTAWEEANTAIKETQQSIDNYENKMEELGEKVADVYSDFAKNNVVNASADGARIAAEGMIAQYENAAKKATEHLSEEQENLLNDLNDKLEELDFQKDTHQISDDDYWSQRRKILNDNFLQDSADWWKYYDEVTEHYEKLSETERKAQEAANKTQQDNLKKSVDDQISLVKEKQELDNSYTKEMMYNDMETIISGLDKESELYKKYNSEILKGRKALADEGAKTIKDGFKEEISEAENSIKSLVSEYQNSLKQLMSDRDTYFNKLFDTSSFTSRSKQKDANGDEADIFSLSDPEEAYKKLVDYEKAVEKLKAKGVSENVMSWIDTLDAATAQDTIDVLNHMTDSSLKTYSDSFDKYKAKAEQMADNKYAPQIDELNKGFIEKVDALIAELPAKAEVDGENTVAGYINGLKSKESDLSAAVTEFTDSIINKIKENLDIHSPSGAAEDLGDYTAKGYIKGLNSEDMSDAVDNFTSSFLTKLAQKDPAIREAMENTFAGNMAAALGNMESLADVSLNNIASLLSGKIPALPDITKMSLPSYDAVSSAAGSSDLSVIAAKLDKLDTIISLIQSITVLSANGQKIKLELELNGRLTADMNSFVAVIAQKFNNLSIQTSKKVFSY